MLSNGAMVSLLLLEDFSSGIKIFWRYNDVLDGNIMIPLQDLIEEDHSSSDNSFMINIEKCSRLSSPGIDLGYSRLPQSKIIMCN